MFCDLINTIFTLQLLIRFLINKLNIFQEKAGTFQVQKPVVHGRIKANC